MSMISLNHARSILVSSAAIVLAASLGACSVATTGTGTTSDGKDTVKVAGDQSKFTKSQQEAISSAEQYLSTEAFSKVGLIQQLSSKAGEGFPKKDAIFAVDHIKVDWNHEAYLSAKQYLDSESFSKAGLITQLESKAGENFTHAQAVYGANHAFKK